MVTDQNIKKLLTRSILSYGADLKWQTISKRPKMESLGTNLEGQIEPSIKSIEDSLYYKTLAWDIFLSVLIYVTDQKILKLGVQNKGLVTTKQRDCKFDRQMDFAKLLALRSLKYRKSRTFIRDFRFISCTLMVPKFRAKKLKTPEYFPKFSKTVEYLMDALMDKDDYQNPVW